jgi:lipopolysaccharide transport system ATP-binding protein
MKGRIASLLEVGTGFHPEMTGRENIYQNGAILGMTRHEITRKFDEIVDFSGCEAYIDTPVKRYSSGMYVRLAFAVAAHLESEILIVDEVLAVGDAEFQKKCLGKMNDVAKGEGRTVLFVSHNMAAIETLCNKGILLANGNIEYTGNEKEAIEKYLDKNNNYINLFSNNITIGNNHIELFGIDIYTNDSQYINVNNEINIEFRYVNKQETQNISVGYDLYSLKGDILFSALNLFFSEKNVIKKTKCVIPKHMLNDGQYYLSVYFHTEAMRQIFTKNEVISFEVNDVERENAYLGKINGFFRPKLEWTEI